MADGGYQLLHAPLASLDDFQRLRTMARKRGAEARGKFRRFISVEAHVIDRPAALANLGGEMPHRGQEQRNARLVRPDRGRFAGSLDHQYAILRRIEAGQGRTGQVQLVAEDEDQVAHGSIKKDWS